MSSSNSTSLFNLMAYNTAVCLTGENKCCSRFNVSYLWYELIHDVALCHLHINSISVARTCVGNIFNVHMYM